jgi:hypothetical protein
MGWVFSTTPRPFYPRERPGNHCTGGWVGPRAGLACAKNRTPTGIRSPDRPARSQSLYRLNYPARKILYVVDKNGFLLFLKFWTRFVNLMQKHFVVTPFQVLTLIIDVAKVLKFDAFPC